MIADKIDRLMVSSPLPESVIAVPTGIGKCHLPQEVTGA